MQRLVEIAPIPPVPLHDLLTYGVPDALHDLAPGMRVRIPLGRQARVGVVAGFAVTPPPADSDATAVRDSGLGTRDSEASRPSNPESRIPNPESELMISRGESDEPADEPAEPRIERYRER